MDISRDRDIDRAGNVFEVYVEFIRGFTGYRNLLLVDGVRFNNSVFRDGPVPYWNLIDEFLIDLAGKVEIVYSPIVDAKEYPENVDVVPVTHGVGLK